ncbi:flagellar hook-length control protein FliK [Hoeflea sp. IMCC20628]|uniref:flagellar hook-length control protein FliK n=1 Tax=Hoeflea sp. IMCC20628 TaxID=1620421 RepID=UPI00063ADC14|nr:flagellar hook-length control protein FliK [Hoeflea sp. IMCC20628]
MQRQVPARASTGLGESVAAESKGGTGNAAFSAILFGEQRSAAGNRGRLDTNDRSDAEADAETVDTEEYATDNQSLLASSGSDEMLTLLSGLMSSAAFSEEPGKLVSAETPPDEVMAAESGIDEVASGVLTATQQMNPTTSASKVTNLTSEDQDAKSGLQGQAKSDSVETPQSKSDARANNASPAIALNAASAAPGLAPALSIGAGQGAQSPTKAQSSEVTADKQKKSAAPRDGLGALGVSREASPTSMAEPRTAETKPSGTAEPRTAETKASGNDRPSGASERNGGGAATKEALAALGLSREASPASTAEIKASGNDGLSGASGRKSASVDRQPDEQIEAKPRTVEVVESRRFMPATQVSGNAQLLTSALGEAGDAALAAQRSAPTGAAAGAAAPQTGQTLHTLKLQLNPMSLGSVTAVMKLSGEALSVELKVESAEAYRQLSDDSQSIVKSLRAQGYAVEQITIQHVASPDKSANQGFSGGFQGNEPGDAKSSGGNNNGNNTNQQNQQGRQGHEHTSNVGSGTGRSDGVYL